MIGRTLVHYRDVATLHDLDRADGVDLIVMERELLLCRNDELWHLPQGGVGAPGEPR